MPIKLITFGCRLNTYESEVIKTFLQDKEEFKNANVVIFNSCTVTSEAEKQLRQAIRKERRENPDAIIGVVGCAVQTNSSVYEEMEEVDFVFGNYVKMNKKNYDLLIPIIQEKLKENKHCCCHNHKDNHECHCHDGEHKCHCHDSEEEHECHCHEEGHECHCHHNHNEKNDFVGDEFNYDEDDDCCCDDSCCDCEEDDDFEEESKTINPIKELNFDILDKTKPVIIDDLTDINDLNVDLITGFEEKTRGFIQIQNGCDNHCTFCATRLARGKSISIPSNKVIEQINKLVENGYNEIVLTGIDITDYGKRLNEDINLGKLIKKIIKETDLKRLRLSSIDIADVNDDLKDVLFNEERLMPHIHISLQSGDNTILKKMARRHNREQVIDFANEIRKYRKNIGIGADLIAGFPTETEEMHKNSLRLIEEIGLVFGHIFPYSVREGTIAGRMEQVPMETRRRRAKELRELCEKQLNEFAKQQSKLPHKILIENEKVGRTENYLIVNLTKDILKSHKIGDVVEIEKFTYGK